jgi:predicted nucleic acid-binding protein
LAIERIEAWLSHENVRLLHESEDQWNILRQLLIETGTSGNRTTDAHLAAMAIAYGATLVSCDSDFARYRQLRWENPAMPTN